ncbi:MAG: CBS domain-containing protein [Actinomycetes bacterium]
MTEISAQARPAPKVSDVMAGPVICLDVEQPVSAATRLMRQHRISDVVVTEAGRPVAVVSDRQLSARLASKSASESTSVGEVCPTEMITVAPEDDVRWAAVQMSKHSMRRLPVSADDAIVGFVSMGDVAGFFEGFTTTPDTGPHSRRV